jgi:hypothetical protein
LNGGETISITIATSNPFLPSLPSDEPLNPGDVIFYWHELFVCGNPVGERYGTIRDIDPDRDPILRLNTMDPLQSTHRVKRVKIMQSDGTLVENAAATWKEISEYRIKKSAEAPYQISREGAGVGSILGR